MARARVGELPQLRRLLTCWSCLPTQKLSALLLASLNIIKFEFGLYLRGFGVRILWVKFVVHGHKTILKTFAKVN